MKGFKDKIWFIFLSLIVFLFGFINIKSTYPLQELVAMSLIFFGIIIFQILIVLFFSRLRSFLLILFSIGNFYFFNIVLNHNNFITNLVFISIFAFIVFIISRLKEIKYSISFLSIFITLNILNWVVEIKFKTGNDLDEIKTNNFKGKKAKTNIFFIGIDGMMSSRLYERFYNEPSFATQTLKELGFLTQDIESPGNNTLETYSKLITYGNNSFLNNYYKNDIINSESQFYIDSKELHFRKQFIFFNKYFGGDPNKIFDQYYPDHVVPFGFILFTDHRWGWYIVKVLNFFYELNKPNANFNLQYSIIKNQLSLINLNNQKWFSISHLWFPGHTMNNYDVRNLTEFQEFKQYYKNAQIQLAKFFKEIVQVILNKDKSAIIIFMGDHGSFMLNGSKIGDRHEKFGIISESLLKKDRRDVLLGIYPNNLFTEMELFNINKKPEKLWETLLGKASN